MLFGYFASTQYFGDMTDINLKQMLFKQRMQEIEDDMVPFGFIDDASEHIENIEKKETPWAIEYSNENF